jgi:hypothetical protein
MITEKKSLIYFLLLISLASCGTSQKKKEIKFRCNSERIEPKPIPIPEKYSVPIPTDIKKKRALETEVFKDFNIYLDLENFEQEAQVYGISNDLKEMFSQGMKKAVKTLTSLLRVKKLNSNYKISDEQIIAFGINQWNETNIGTNAEKTILEVGIDLFIFVRFGDKQELGDFTLASAGARYLDTGTGQPIIGVANINKDIDINILLESSIFKCDIKNKMISKYIDCSKIILNRDINVIGCESSSDAVYFYGKNIPTIIMNPVGGYPHGKGEFVNKKSLEDLYEIYSLFLKEVEIYD